MSDSIYIDSFERTYNTTALIILGQIFLVLVLFSVAWLLEPTVSSSASDSSFRAEWIAGVAAIVLAIVVILLRRILFSWNRLRTIAIRNGILSVIKTLHVNTIFLGVIAELIALIGFVMSIYLTGDKFDALRLSAVSLLLFLILFPRKSKWRDIVSASEKALNLQGN